MKRLEPRVITIAIALLFARSAKADCDPLVALCPGRSPDSYVPSWANYVLSERQGFGRFAELHLWWANEGRLAAFDDPYGLDTLEPDIMLPDVDPYAIAITSLEWQPQVPTAISFRKLPCAYVDTPIDDQKPIGDGVTKPTIGSGCAGAIQPGSLYYSVARVSGTAATSSMGLRFQRGRWLWIDGCVTFTFVPFGDSSVTPSYGLAPYCVFSCCDAQDPSGNNFEVLHQNSGHAPGCYTWDGSSSIRCVEKLCALQ